MVRFSVRVLGLWLLAGGFAAAVIDGMKSIAASQVVLSSAHDTWSDLAPAALSATDRWIAAHLGSTAGGLFTLLLDRVPTFALLGGIGTLLIAVALPREDEDRPLRS